MKVIYCYMITCIGIVRNKDVNVVAVAALHINQLISVLLQ